MKHLLAAALLYPTLALAHHGVAGVGTAALEGPGAVWTNLNESAAQHGAEGKEKYRLVFSASILI